MHVVQNTADNRLILILKPAIKKNYIHRAKHICTLFLYTTIGAPGEQVKA